jgi:prepilin-type processing-associated H-X9-DG protein
MRSRDMSRRASCLSNMRQLTVAFSSYTEDYDYHLPHAAEGLGGATRENGWVYYSTFTDLVTPTQQVPTAFDVTRGSLFPYVKNKQIYICPSDYIGSRSGASYAYNNCLTDPAPGLSGFHLGRQAAKMENPGQWMVLCEEEAWFLGIGLTGVGNGGTNDGFMMKDYDYLSLRHLGGSLVTFLDGHVKWYREESIISKNFQTGGQNVPGCGT